MSALRAVFLGSSTTVGTNLSSPTTERYEALFRTYIRAARSIHCRTSVVALAGIGIYEQQATGFSTPGNRSETPVNTSTNITTALATKPTIVFLHQPAANIPEAIADWSLTTQAAIEDFLLNEQLALVRNIRTLCIAASVRFVCIGSHPIALSVLTAEESAANFNGCREYWNDILRADNPGNFIDYWDDIDDGTGNGDPNLLLADGRHPNALGGVPMLEGQLEAAGFDTWQNRLTPLDIDP